MGGGSIAIAFFNCVTQDEFWLGITDGHNLIQYAFTCASFGLAFACFYWLFGLKLLQKDIVLNIACAAACIGIAAFHYVCWEQEPNIYVSPAGTYPWHRYPTILVFLILSCVTLLYKIVTEHMYIEAALVKKIQFLYYVGIVVVSGYLNYYPEYLATDYLHGSAIYTSVYNVLHGIPYDRLTNCIYGNYAIFLAIPMKILGTGEYFDFARIMSVLTSVSVALCIYIIHYIVERKTIRLLCVSILPYPFLFFNSNYWQLSPLRLICPLLLIAWLVFVYRHQEFENKSIYHKLLIKLATYFLLTCSIVWNKETGIVCLIGYLAYLAIQCIVRFAAGVSGVLGCLLEGMVMMTSVAAALCVVGFYNLIVAGQWVTWDTFFFPLFVSSYRDGVLMIPLAPGIWPWMGTALLFLGMFASMLYRAVHRAELTLAGYICIVAAVIGLGSMTYFMNRTAYGNMLICYFEAVICLGGCFGLLEQSDCSGYLHKYIGMLLSMILVALIAGEMLQIENAVNSNAYAGLNSYKRDFLELRDRIAREVEPDTYAFGIDIPELYSVLGWNNRSHTSGWGEIGDVYGDRVAALYTDLEREDTLMTTSSTMSRWPEVSEYLRTKYYIAKIYTYQNNVDSVKFYLMKRRPE